MSNIPTAASTVSTVVSLRRRLLIVDDESAILRALERVFHSDFEVSQAEDGEQALHVARQFKPHVVICDQSMPNMTGVELLSRIREEMPDTVRILVTGYTDYSSLVDAVNAAQVHHYFEKPFHTVDLRTVVEALLRSHYLELERERLLRQLDQSVRELQTANGLLADGDAELQRRLVARTQELGDNNTKLHAIILELEQANKQLRDLAVRDALTGLFNFRYLMEHAQIELARCQRYARRCTVLFLDVDNFKAINDTYGHAVGDQVLCTVANLLRPSQEGLRRSDFAARYGGEEFCLLLPETPLNGGATKGERLREAVATFDWQVLEPRLLSPITVSVGVAAYPEHGATLRGLIDAADAAHYSAKRAGKNQVCVAPIEEKH